MQLASDTPLPLSRTAFEQAVAFVRTIYRLKNNAAYLELLAGKLPEAAGILPESSGILMGFDFHLHDHGVKLIEINNNAGGLFTDPHVWIPQPPIPELAGTLPERLAGMFPSGWRRIAIMDEAIEEQFMYPEMQAYAELLRSDGREAFLVSPEQLQERPDGLYAGESRIDAIYNRHTDFYLESPEMRHIRHAYLAGKVQLNPHPRSYALLGDKGRMADWWRDGLLEKCLEKGEVELIRNVVPETRQLGEYDPDEVWQQRSRWVFKPAAKHGGKGVLLGKSVSRKRFGELDPATTVLQEFVPASQVEIDGNAFKLDIRLFTHGEELVAVAGRVWQGQVTNFRVEGSGWVSLSIE